MNRNQKIALGCGGAGCLGLIVVVIAGVLIYFFMYRSPSRSTNRNFNYNVNVNSNSNRNSSTNLNGNENSNENENENAPSTSSNSTSSSSSASSVSNDEKHRLFQAASQSGDSELVRTVLVKVGLLHSDFTPAGDYSSFMNEHVKWGAENADFIMSIGDPAKAKAYVDEHLPE
jgi:hypothetical protein